MSNGREVVVLSGTRTAIGDYGGGLKDIAPTELAAHVIKEAAKRSNSTRRKSAPASSAT